MDKDVLIKKVLENLRELEIEDKSSSEVLEELKDRIKMNIKNNKAFNVPNNDTEA